MSGYGPTLRLALLLHRLNTDEFKPLPPGLGRRTVKVADEAGFVEVSDSSRFPMCRLTAAGLAYRKANPYRFD
jgi:hypothetical protein